MEPAFLSIKSHYPHIVHCDRNPLYSELCMSRHDAYNNDDNNNHYNAHISPL
ncbi:hypothetical protein E2C01_085842 [Portunus trituberculatus]|uniref:Uncharacterized protein n=1 Tax=Portunus trituberculatus TaxID=210409 RepID=A0A5B7J231_PORTR|nr:hypothetical protein [Portunus trituberculatus]